MGVKDPYLKGRRLRLFGGPNGSGKSTIFQDIDKKYDLGIYLNPDEIEKDLKSISNLNLYQYGLDDEQISTFEEYQKGHTLIKKAESVGLAIDLERKGSIVINPRQESHSYEASFLSDYIRSCLLKMGKKLSFESVMSHPSKIEIMRIARMAGYKNYLYYIATENPEINIERVRLRVKQGGHPVPENKIKSRYYGSLNQLKSAVVQSYRAFIFDNSESKARLIMEFYEGDEYTFHHSEVPNWVDEYLLN